jgi:hypothetical protein
MQLNGSLTIPSVKWGIEATAYPSTFGDAKCSSGEGIRVRTNSEHHSLSVA